MENGEIDPVPAKGYVEQMDGDASSPGPEDTSVLYDQVNHVSSAVWDGQERGVLRCHEHTSKLGEWRLTKKQIALVDKAGFGCLRLLPSISLDNPLISALVERWRRETNTFHFTVGEMTVTLEDVALLLGLPIDGEPVLGVTHTSCKPVCERFLGKTPEAGYMSGGMVKLSWLKEYFSHCREDASLEEIERHTRAYLLYLVGSTIFSTTTGNKVPVMYLPLFEDFEKAGKYAWGAAALAFLYRALGKASHRSQSTISGGLTLLQCWSYFHLNIGRPKFYQEPALDCFPFVLRWKGKQSAATMKRDLGFYRKALDSLDSSEVEWLPYKTMDDALIPESIRSTLILGRSRTMLICFDKAERHLPDRCLRQYDMVQGIPEDVQQWERKRRGLDLCGKMGSELNEWSSRELSVVLGRSGVDGSEYMHWYSRITRKFVGRPSPLPQFQRTVNFRTKKKRMSAGLRDIAHIADMFSTEGLDPIQHESIWRIRAIAHDCLGDNNAKMAMESSKKREKEHVWRKAKNAKQQQVENDQSCFPVGGMALEADQTASHSDGDMVHQQSDDTAVVNGIGTDSYFVNGLIQDSDLN
ncbi:Protein MAIN-LIKE 2 [Linum grandiflorum]